MPLIEVEGGATVLPASVVNASALVVPIPAPSGDATGATDTANILAALATAAALAATGSAKAIARAASGGLYQVAISQTMTVQNPSGSAPATVSVCIPIPNNVVLDMNDGTLQLIASSGQAAIVCASSLSNLNARSHDYGLVNAVIDGNHVVATSTNLGLFPFSDRVSFSNVKVINGTLEGMWFWDVTDSDFDDLRSDGFQGQPWVFGDPQPGGNGDNRVRGSRFGRLSGQNTTLLNTGSQPGNPFYLVLQNCTIDSIETKNCSAGIKIGNPTDGLSIGEVVVDTTGEATALNSGFKLQGSNASGGAVEFIADVQSGTNTLLNCSSITGLVSKTLITGPGIPSGTYINGAPSGTTVTMSQNATATATQQPISQVESRYVSRVNVGQVVAKRQANPGLYMFWTRDCAIGTYIGFNNCLLHSAFGDVVLEGGLNDYIGSVKSTNSNSNGIIISGFAPTGYRIANARITNPGQLAVNTNASGIFRAGIHCDVTAAQGTFGDVVCIDSQQTFISSLLSTGGAITSLPVLPMVCALPSGSVVTTVSGGHTQTWTLSAGAAINDTSLAVTSQVPNFAYPVGSQVLTPTMGNGTEITVTGVTGYIDTYTCTGQSGSVFTSSSATFPTPNTGAAVASVFARTGAVVATSGDYTVAQVTGAAPLASPALTGTPTAPTATALDSSTKVATTAYTDSAVAVETSRAEGAEALLAPLASPALTGTPTAPTKTALTNNTAIATTAYADGAVAVEKSRALTAEALLIPLADVTAKGDILVATGSAAVARLGIGSTGQVPTVNAAGTLAYQTPGSPIPGLVTPGGLSPAAFGTLAALSSLHTYFSRVVIPPSAGNILHDLTIYVGTLSGNVSVAVYDTGDASAGNYSHLWDSGAVPAGSVTTLSSALSTGGGAITTLPIAALTVPLAASTNVTVVSGANTQTFTVTAAAAVGATSLTITSATPNFNYPIGSAVTQANVFQLVGDPALSVSPGQQLMLAYSADNATVTTARGALGNAFGALPVNFMSATGGALPKLTATGANLSGLTAWPSSIPEATLAPINVCELVFGRVA